ncbi:MAG: ribose-phosphate pyrophosphokinase [Dongiaceae bacterium]
MTPLIWVATPGNEAMTARLAAETKGDIAALEARRFPDGETYLRLRTDVSGRNVAVVCTLDRPDGKYLPLAFAAATARDLGATRVGLVAPYLAYMRQDRRFKDGEAVTSGYFARMISAGFDWLVTVAPHLHRHKSLDEIYTIPSRVVHADQALADWIGHNISSPLIVGPDSESAQWAGTIAARAHCPHVVLNKHRRGDREVAIDLPDLSAWQGRKPVLVDDIISSAATMIEGARLLAAAGMAKPDCVAIHGVFADDSFRKLSALAARVVTTNTVAHESNQIDISAVIAAAAAEMSAL